jgi:hypothetical protein
VNRLRTGRRVMGWSGGCWRVFLPSRCASC